MLSLLSNLVCNCYCIRYESIPDDLRSAEYKGRGHASVLDVTESSSRLTPVIVPGGIGPERSNPILGALSRYTYNQRWVWKMSCQTKALPIGAVAAILYALTKYAVMILKRFGFYLSLDRAFGNIKG